MLKQHNPQLVFFMKKKVDGRCMERIRRGYGYRNDIEVEAEVSRGGLSSFLLRVS